jgi:hypothetical protein
LDAKLIAQYEENMTGNEQRNIGLCTETQTPLFFTLPPSSVDAETASFQLRMRMATTYLTQMTLLMNLFITLKQFFTRHVLTMTAHS